MDNPITTTEGMQLRLLGYYNLDGQTLKEETEQVSLAQELAELLDKTFQNIEDVNNDEGFAAALRDGVFILRDKDFHLYAYWPKNKVARVTGVAYNREVMTILPLAYKYWFVPGEELTIAPLNEPNTIYQTPVSMFDYLRSVDSIGRRIQVSMSFLPGNGSMLGELVSVGRDYIVLRDGKGNETLISNHFCIQLNPQKPVPALSKKMGGSPDDEVMSPMGVIESMDTQRGLGWVMSNYGTKYGLRLTELLESTLKVGSKIVFGLRNEVHANGHSIIQATFVHSATTVQNTLDLAASLMEQKRLKEARAVLQHILNEYPDNDDAQEMLTVNGGGPKPIPQDEDSKLYQLACDKLANDKDKQEALNLFMSILEKGKRVKDCILKIAVCYFAQYSQEEDEEVKSVIRKQLMDFVQANHSKLSPASSLNFRLQYYLRLEMDDEYLATIDSVLQDPTSDNKKRAKMLYYKALKLQDEKGLGGVRPWLEESLYLNPFNNKAELLLPEFQKGTDGEPTNPEGFSQIATIQLENAPAADSGDEYLSQDKSSPGYPKALLASAAAYKDSPDKQSVVTALMAEYFAFRARELSKDAETISSARYLWGEMFAIVPGFGYFLQFHLAEMLAAILGVPLISDPSIQTFSPWQNRKDWKEVLLSAAISKEEWEHILYGIRKNSFVQTALLQFIAGKPALLESLNDTLKRLGCQPLDPDRATATVYPFGTITDVIARNRPDEQAMDRFRAVMLGKKLLAEKQEAFHAIDIREDPFDQLADSERQTLELFYSTFVPILDRYVLETSAQERTAMAEEFTGALTQIKQAIAARPDMFIAEGLCAQIPSIETTFKKVQTASTNSALPQLNVRVVEDVVRPDRDGYYLVRLEVENVQRAMPATNIRMELASKKLANALQPVLIDQLDGGSSYEFTFRAKLFEEAKAAPNWGFAVKCTYSFKGKTHEQVFTPLQVRFQPGQFIPIEKNPYTYGPQLKSDDPTFVGRKTEIREIIDKVLHPQRSGPQLIVYGQKRCGKSTLLGAVTDTIEKDYSDRAWCVSMTLRIDRAARTEKIYTDVDFYRAILGAIQSQLIGCNDPEKPAITVPTRAEFENGEAATDLFCECISQFKRNMAQTPGWENRRLVVIIDEFTILYNCIKKGTASENLLHNWKAIQESEQTCFATIFIGHDITPSFFAEPYATNAALIIERYPLSYLDTESAKELIERPILADGKSRFDAKAVDRILYYTAGSPWFLQIFMQQMVNYINDNKVVTVTDIDVYNVAQRFVNKQVETLSKIKDFSSLVNSGMDDRYTVIKDAQFEAVLREIAKYSKGLEWCSASLLDKDPQKGIDESLLREILDDLDNRKVIERKENNQLIRIKVGLFKEWLIRN